MHNQKFKVCIARLGWLKLFEKFVDLAAVGKPTRSRGKAQKWGKAACALCSAEGEATRRVAMRTLLSRGAKTEQRSGRAEKPTEVRHRTGLRFGRRELRVSQSPRCDAMRCASTERHECVKKMIAGKESTGAPSVR